MSSVEKTRWTLWELLEKRRVEIPLIQRDYAQGRTDSKTSEIRRGFVTSIAEALNAGKSLDFDFVYGQDEQHKSEPLLKPMDGQQRLTTLFLVHWYLAVRDGELPGAREILGKFTYKTRQTTTDFLTQLVTNNLDLPEPDAKRNTLSVEIKDQPWFLSSWMRDPTVAGMLVMLDELHQELYRCPLSFRDLVQGKHLTFYRIPMDGLDLDDETYVRMNARGKPLTEFEYFKAEFEKFLAHGEAAATEDINHKMDVTWARSLWPYRDEKTNTVDSVFMELFRFTTEVSYYFVRPSDEKRTFMEYAEQEGRLFWQSIYKDQRAVERFVVYMDLLAHWAKTGGVSRLFHQLDVPPVYGADSIHTIRDGADLIRRCSSRQNFGIPERLLLFLVFEYARRHGDDLNTVELSERLRVLRNLVERQWQADKYNFGYKPELRYIEMPGYLSAAEALASLTVPVYVGIQDEIDLGPFTKSLEHEREKGSLILDGRVEKSLVFELEDDALFKGTIAVLVRDLAPSEVSEYRGALYEIAALQDRSLPWRALLTLDQENGYTYFGVDYGQSAIGARWYFGNNEHWHGLLTRHVLVGDEVLPSIQLLLKEYVRRKSEGGSAESILQTMVNEWLGGTPEYDTWRYYFIRYKEILDSQTNLFAWPGNQDDIHDVRTMSSFSAVGNHKNTLSRAVAEILGKGGIVRHDTSQTGRHSEYRPLILSDDTRLWSEREGWRVRATADRVHDRAELSMAPHPDGSEDFLLRPTQSEDRIEVAVRFIRSLFPEVDQ